ncbi:TetR family transcriptional regulator [Alicyclobacillus hesperidum subsp. aegles]|uniref:TetR/AcrR family transcriptional regulator n=1 Tax=Alicyclobacillus hesperidum TaxID=89784 RepID=UPI00222D7FDF|nr:TetR/AcrR family transcriptional regulator [Alicyclobacillus hesperidum]GLG02465.1 TetR family transcriptional regulator [Alicyclobacillus hesperidum subsp. aegles]
MLDLREKIEAAAKQAFSEFGYKATTMDQVARLAGISKGAIYIHFPSKEALFGNMLQELIAHLREAVEAELQPNADFFDNLERGLRRVVAFRQEHAVFAKLAQEVRQFGTEPARAGLRHVEHSIVDYLKGYLERGIAEGDVKPCDPEIVAFVLMRTYTTLVNDWADTHEPLSNENLILLFHQLFADGLRNSSKVAKTE